MTTTVLALSLVTWLVTNIVVDSELFRPLRSWISSKQYEARHGKKPVQHVGGLQSFTEAMDRILKGYIQGPAHPRRFKVWSKVNYLVTCKLCAGTWIALLAVTVQPDARPLGTGFVGWLLAGLLVKAVAHGILELSAVAQEYARPA